MTMELTVTFYCHNPTHNPTCRPASEEQIETINIRRGQRVILKCGFCEEVAVEIQANREQKALRNILCRRQEKTLKQTKA